jgi:RNA polymerase sigma-70 factor (ECF subfamily)
VERHERNELQRCLTRLADGDRSAFRSVFDLAWPRVREIAGRMMSHAADDAAQDALLKLFERASEFDPARDALAWIVGIVSYECLTSRKKLSRRRESGGEELASVADRTASPEEQVMSVELEQLAVAILGQLRPDDRETLRIAIFGEGRRDAKPATFRKRV